MAQRAISNHVKFLTGELFWIHVEIPHLMMPGLLVCTLGLVPFALFGRSGVNAYIFTGNNSSGNPFWSWWQVISTITKLYKKTWRNIFFGYSDRSGVILVKIFYRSRTTPSGYQLFFPSMRCHHINNARAHPEQMHVKAATVSMLRRKSSPFV